MTTIQPWGRTLHSMLQSMSETLSPRHNNTKRNGFSNLSQLFQVSSNKSRKREFCIFLLRQFTLGKYTLLSKDRHKHIWEHDVYIIRNSESGESKENYDVPHRSQTMFPYILVYYHALRVRSMLNTLSRGNTRGRAFKHWLQCTLRDTLLWYHISFERPILSLSQRLSTNSQTAQNWGIDLFTVLETGKTKTSILMQCKLLNWQYWPIR